MKFIAILLPLFILANNADACSLMPNFEQIRKNEMVVAALNQVGMEIENVKNLKTSDFQFNFEFTFSDPGFECHDTETGSVNVNFTGSTLVGYVASYDAVLSKQMETLEKSNDWEAVSQFFSTPVTCEVSMTVKHTLKPTSATEPAWPYQQAENIVATCDPVAVPPSILPPAL